MPPTTNSDSDDDFDYVPPADDDGSDSSDDQEQVEPTPGTAPPLLSDVAEQKKQRDSLWASFQASLSTPPSNAIGTPTSTPSQSSQTQTQTQLPVVKRVKIEKTFLFAGKHVTEVVEVPENSEDAAKWPRWSPCPRPTSDGVAAGTGKEKDDGEGRERESDSPAPPPSAVDPSPAPLPPMTTTATSTPGAKRPGPRKPWTALPSIPKASQAKKITTLDKTAMDWRAHVASQSGDVKDELDANRRGGGYLEKVDFLKRVQDRREEAFEGSKLNKRRKT
ncbi:bucentaur or craniofacial development-domain-containing protein, partial [Boletus edulis]